MSLVIPGDARHPVRLDLPIWRHLTYEEAHALEMGVYVTVLVYLGLMFGYVDASIMLLFYVARVALGKQRAKKDKTGCEHTLGIHDIRDDPWYFGFSALLTAGVMVLVWGYPV